MKHYDAIIIGSGQAGIPLAKKLAEAGKKTAIIEKNLIGGTCINNGCTPTKSMIASARAAHQARNAIKLGIETGTVKVDLKSIKKRTDEIVLTSRTNLQKKIDATKGLDLIFGEAAFTAKKELCISSDKEKENLSANWIFINTGAKPIIPKLKGLEKVSYLTSTTILDLEEIPEHLIIIGGNYIGLEFGQMFQRFGSQVTIIEKASRIMNQEDEDVSEELTTILKDEGLQILTDVNVTEAEEIKGQITISIESKNGVKRITGTHLLLAVGRTPQSESLNLVIPGIATDKKGNILVNEKLETNVEGVYALGDVNGGPAFTHISYNDFVVVYRNLIKKADCSTSHRDVPYCMFTDPQLARIGISESQAKEEGLDFLVAKIPLTQVARGIETGETLGFIKVLVDPKSKKILGACVLSAEGGEIMTVIQMAMEGGITYNKLQYFIFAHPIYSEALNNLFKKIKV